MHIRSTTDTSDNDWLNLRAQFFPEDFPGEHQQFLQSLRVSGSFTAFIANDEDGIPTGFAEVAIRHDYVNGCQHRPALFLEGIFVRPEHRGKGIAHALCKAAAEFGAGKGCKEFASDVEIGDANSLAAHAALGFAETERVVYFRMPLQPATDDPALKGS
ncbi:MAG: aminoglycoside 6'-N-acetyltransferase [Xanthomonadales bacterium]|nr:aminoglycoside 6'-N-acetyltransferase [Xanthomonadales bacterium]